MLRPQSFGRHVTPVEDEVVVEAEVVALSAARKFGNQTKMMKMFVVGAQPDRRRVVVVVEVDIEVAGTVVVLWDRMAVAMRFEELEPLVKQIGQLVGDVVAVGLAIVVAAVGGVVAELAVDRLWRTVRAL